MRWEYEVPEPKVFVSDGKMIWSYVPADRTATKQAVKQSEDWRTPLGLLTGKVNLSRLCGRIEFASGAADSLGPDATTGDAVLRCWPKGEKPPARDITSADPMTAGETNFTEVLLEVESASGRLDDVRVREPGNVELEFRFGDWKENEPLPSSLFEFMPPKGVAIVPWVNTTESAE